MPRILYIGQTPAEGTGSPVIILRHLQRLAADGWQVTIIAENGQDTSACVHAGWTIHSLPLRRAWWPSFRDRSEWSRTVRTWLLAGECLRLTSATKPDAVLGYLAAHADFSAEVASRYARRSGVPLTLLVHDEAAAFTTVPREKRRLRRRHRRILCRAHKTWFVSGELAIACGRDADAGVLPPLPGATTTQVGWQPAFAGRPLVYYAGFIWPAQFLLLREIADVLAGAGATLVLLTRETPELAEFVRSAPVRHVAPFATNRDALAHLSTHAAGILVAYTHTVLEMPWIATSFPSKLVEQCRLGAPCAIVAPVESAVGRWAHRETYADFFAPSERVRLASWARDLGSESGWLRRAASARRLAVGDFHPEKIHATFTAGLLRT